MEPPIKLTTVLTKEAAHQLALAWINEAIELHSGDTPLFSVYWWQREDFHNIFNSLEWPNEGIKITIELIPLSPPADPAPPMETKDPAG